MKATAKNRGTVLIVDGDPAVLVLIQRILVAADHHVLLAAERADAVHIARQKHIRIDLVLLDERIPGVSGTDLADEIAALRPGVRMLWMSGFVDDGFIRIRLFDGHTGRVSKKLYRDGLLPAVQQAIEGPRPGRRARYLRAKTLTAGARV
ncbi:MAG TPA: response regulator [Bryobacteraceae bacterium]|jgi:DNA-binding NtrC family response regulator|nr:response regulator [Bryobacteraceae bacterium]